MTLERLPLWLAIGSVIALIIQLGFPVSPDSARWLMVLNVLSLSSGIVMTVVRHAFLERSRRWKVLIADLISMLLFAGVLAALRWDDLPDWIQMLDHPLWRNTALFLVLLREIAARQIDLRRTYLNPAQIFMLSFLSIMLAGTLLLSLPKATYAGISFIDALFTATSAVCVTGLIVVDTATHFTWLGQNILLILIQIGGLGIMTFASYFSYFFRGGTTYENQLVLSQMSQGGQLGEVFSTLKKIILITAFIELAGAAMIYSTISAEIIPEMGERVYFAIFHSISGFCNAGFSTLTNSLYESPYRFNYPLHLIIAGLFMIGGIGFPIVFNLLTYLRKVLRESWNSLRQRRAYMHRPWLINLHTRIVMITSFCLIIAGTVLIFYFEYNHTLAPHSMWGKMVTAFFGATTPRTAGFNSVDMLQLQFPTLMIILLLMWVGASPGSTGGGIKTSTFAIATLNFISLARGKTRIEVYRREIADLSVRRAFAIIALSLVMIGFGTFLIATFDPEKELLGIAFECFSAYSTVGLSIGVTAELTQGSKLVLVVLMFSGRVGMLTLLIAFLPKVPHKAYNYPTEEILIN